MALETEVLLTTILTIVLDAKSLEEAQEKLKTLISKEKLAEIEKTLKALNDSKK